MQGAGAVPPSTLILNVRVRVSDPLVPVTVTLYVPTEPPLQDRIDVCDPPSVILFALKVHARPEAGDIDDVRTTLPVNPLTAARVIVDVTTVPDFATKFVGLAVSVKSSIATVIVVTRIEPEVPFVPVTVTEYVPAVVVLDVEMESVEVRNVTTEERVMLVGLTFVTSPP